MIKIKQVDLAKAAGISEGMVSFILRGERRPSWEVAKKLAKATGSGVTLWMEGGSDLMAEALKNAKESAHEI